MGKYTEKEFQFLIGRLKTVPAAANIQDYIEFQFLIGRLKTEKTKKLKDEGGSVSIPYR